MAEFATAYAGLNAPQKEAVDTVEGPVLVIAGPGTGKTHVLTLRIANILKITQAGAHSVLALTFTDSAARTMRTRLSGLVGEATARDVTITTFHGFAELVMNRYPQHFPGYEGKRLAGEVEQILLLREALEGADVEMLRPPKAPFTYLDDLKRLHETLSRENVSLALYASWGEGERDRIRADESLVYVRGAQAGQLKKEGQEKLERVDKVDEAVRVLTRYQELKEARGTYDFSDMLTTLVGRLAEDDTLRAELQETYQYVLADEHQDANALQHKLLELLAADDFPNLFVVGDEKQAIYRFQGADLGGFRSFTELFPRAKVIALSESFRSFQDILDTAHEVVAPIGEHPRLTATRGEQGPSLQKITASDPLDERAKISSLIQGLISEGTAPHDIAVISRKNEVADLVAQALQASGVPVLRAGDVSLTSRPLPRALLSLMEYIGDPSRFGSLRIALCAPWWKAPAEEMLLMLRRTRDHELLVELHKAYPQIGEVLSSLVPRSIAETPIECFSRIFAESGARDYFLSHAEYLDDISLVRKLMMHLEEVSVHKEGATFREAMEELAQAGEHELSFVKESVTEREGMVTVITAHKAKGMEFKHVVIPDLTENGWERGGKPALIPSPFAQKQSIEDSRRLFYVALTRAKDKAYLSYPAESRDGRERRASVLMPEGLSEVSVEASRLPILHSTEKASELLIRLSKIYLTEDGLSPSALNDYLASPAKFFASRVLRIKEPPQGPLVFGNAVHAGIASLLEGNDSAASERTLENAFRFSLLPRDAVFEALMRDAKRTLTFYETTMLPEGKPIAVEKAFKVTRVVDGVPVILQGKLDALFETSAGECVIDFKTGSTVSAKDEAHVRQLMLYVHLLKESGHAPTCASLIEVGPDRVKEHPVLVSIEREAEALAEFDAVVRELLSGSWRSGEASSYDAVLELVTPS